MADKMKRRKDGRYQDQITVEKGKPRVYFYGKSPADVKRKMALYRQQQATGPLFTEVADEWAGVHRERITPNAWTVYVAPLRRTKEHFSKEYAKDIRPGQIQSYITEISKYDYASRTVQSYLDMLRMMFDFAVVQGYVESNPCLSVHLPSGLKKETRELPTDAQMEIVKKSFDLEFGLYACLLLYTGLRRGELLALRYEDIDFASKEITVNKSVYYTSNQPKEKEPKTKLSNRKIILLDVLSDKLDKDGKGYIFGGKKQLTKSVFRRSWENWCKAAGLVTITKEKRKNKRGKEYEHIKCEATITPHQLRHYYATMLYEAGIPDKDAQLLLGHSNIQTTKDIYTHIRDSKRSETASKLNQYVSSAV